MTPRRKLKVVHVITALDTGGAQHFLLRLLGALPEQVENEVIALGTTEPMGRIIEGIGVPVRTVDMRPGIPNPMALLKLSGLLKRSRPDIVHTWMYHADLVGGLAARLAGVSHVVWCIRISDLRAAHPKRTTLAVAKLSALLSKSVPDRIVCCADTAAETHAALGYDAGRMGVILNGLDTEQFRPNAEDREAVRADLGLAEGEVALGFVGRMHPQKNPRMFVEMAGEILRRHPHVRFVFAGPGASADNEELADWIEGAGIVGASRLLGDRRDIAKLLNGLDLLVSTSLAEGFPNAVAEAMSTGVACVATDVGDTAVVMGEAGILVRPDDLDEVTAAAAMLIVDGQARERLGAAARRRIVHNFNIANAAREYAELYRELVQTRSLG